MLPRTYICPDEYDKQIVKSPCVTIMQVYLEFFPPEFYFNQLEAKSEVCSRIETLSAKTSIDEVA